MTRVEIDIILCGLRREAIHNGHIRSSEVTSLIHDICNNYEAQLKAKDEEIKELGEIVQQYLIPSKNYDAIIRDKDEEIERLKSDVYHMSYVIKEWQGTKARSIVAMLFWEWRKQCKNCKQYNDHAFTREQKRSEAYYCFKKAYAMLKDKQ